MAKDINKYQNDLNLVRNRIIETNKLLRPNKQTNNNNNNNNNKNKNISNFR